MYGSTQTSSYLKILSDYSHHSVTELKLKYGEYALYKTKLQLCLFPYNPKSHVFDKNLRRPQYQQFMGGLSL